MMRRFGGPLVAFLAVLAFLGLTNPPWSTRAAEAQSCSPGCSSRALRIPAGTDLTTTNGITSGKLLCRVNSTITGCSPAGLDTDALHDNVPNEITALDAVAIASGDSFVIEDLSASGAKKELLASALKTGIQDNGGIEISVLGLSGLLADPQTPVQHAIGSGTYHSSSTMDSVNALVSDGDFFGTTKLAQISGLGAAVALAAGDSFLISDTSASEAPARVTGTGAQTAFSAAGPLALTGYALAATTMTAGAGLVGTGDLSASRTFDIGEGAGLDVAADSIALDPTETDVNTFAGSRYRTTAIPPTTTLTTGDAKDALVIDAALNGLNLTAVRCWTTGAPGTVTGVTMSLERSRWTNATTRTLVNVFTTDLTTDAGEYDSADATTPVALNGSNVGVQTGDIYLVNLDGVPTGGSGWSCSYVFSA